MEITSLRIPSHLTVIWDLTFVVCHHLSILKIPRVGIFAAAFLKVCYKEIMQYSAAFLPYWDASRAVCMCPDLLVAFGWPLLLEHFGAFWAPLTFFPCYFPWKHHSSSKPCFVLLGYIGDHVPLQNTFTIPLVTLIWQEQLLIYLSLICSCAKLVLHWQRVFVLLDS